MPEPTPLHTVIVGRAFITVAWGQEDAYMNAAFASVPVADAEAEGNGNSAT